MAISPQVVEKNLEMKTRHGLEFPVLSDLGNTYARQLSLVFTLPDDLRETYSSFGIVLPEYNGDDSWELPIPTRLIVDRHGVIRSVDADPDYTRRPEPETGIEALRAIA